MPKKFIVNRRAPPSEQPFGGAASGTAMILKFADGGTRVEALVGQRRIQAAQSEINALRENSGCMDDGMTSLHRFLSWAAMWGELPVALLMRRADGLHGVALLSLRRKYGIPVGLARAGNLGGQGGVIAAAADRTAVMEAASRVLLRKPFAHTVVLSTLWANQTVPGPVLPVPGVRGQWHFREVRLRLDLSGGLEATMERLGYKMRRNLRYYRRKAESGLGCRFLPALTPEQRQQAVDALQGKGTYPVASERARRLEAALLATPGHFAMGLQDSEGAWLSYLAGWRGAGGTYVDWQLNRDQLESASISTVLRSYLLEHEIARQSPAIIFVGGTSPFWSRVCQPQICGDLLATRQGLAGRLARKIACHVSPSGQVARLHAQAPAAA